MLVTVCGLYLCAGSSLVEVDEAGLRVRPANKRCTVILREIPQDTKVEVIYPCLKSSHRKNSLWPNADSSFPVCR